MQGEYIDKVVLLDLNYYDVVAGSEKTLHLSTVEYTTSENDVPKLTPYNSVITGGISLSKNIDVEKRQASLTWGTINITNSDGWMDTIIRNSSGSYNIFKNRTVNVYLGDASWEKLDFKLIAVLIIDDIDIRDVDSVTLRFKDYLQKLNQPIKVNPTDNSPRTLADLYSDRHSGTVIASSNIRYEDRETPLPICFGECFNVNPVNVDFIYADDTVTGNYYMINDGPIDSIIAVRDSGVTLPPSAYQVIAADGVIKILGNIYGTLTCDVRGNKFADCIKVNTINDQIEELTGQTLYLDDPVNISLNLMSHYGIIQNRLGLQDFDSAAIVSLYEKPFYSVPGAGVVKIGYYGDTSNNIINIVNDLLGSVSCQLTFNNENKLRVVQLVPPELQIDPSVSTITIGDILLKGVSIKDLSAPETQVERLGYAKNYTASSDLAFMVPGATREILEKEYAEVSSTIQVDSNYNLPKKKSTPTTCYLIRERDAVEEADRRASILARRNMVLSLNMTPKAYNLELGDKVTLQYYRFNLDNVDGIIVSKEQDITKNSYTISILI